MIFQAIILGVVQGLTEFLPISSQAHLLLVPYFFNWDYQGLGFDIGLHWGTLLAVLLVFGKDYWRYLRAVISPSPPPSPARGEGKEGGERRMAWYLVVGSIPAAVFGYVFEEQAETVLRNPLITVFTLSVFGFLLWLADKTPPLPSPQKGRGLLELTWKKALGVGVAQAVAIVPGVSRSGVTMTAGLFSGLNREAAARFSFLLSGPIIFGAGLVALQDLVVMNAALVAGFLAAAVSGVVAIKFLLKYLTSHNFNLFVWYRYILAAAVLVVYLMR